MKLLDTTYKLFSPEKARRIARDLQKSDSEWTYKVIDDPKGIGYSFIEIYDEDNKFIERL